MARFLAPGLLSVLFPSVINLSYRLPAAFFDYCGLLLLYLVTEYLSLQVMVPVKQDDYRETFPYASALGAILYLRLTRPDLMVSISILARFMQNPSKAHWTAIKDILRYVKGSLGRGLLYASSGLTLNQPWKLRLWVDSDYATCPDTRRSRAGFLIFLNKNFMLFNNVQQHGSNLRGQ